MRLVTEVHHVRAHRCRRVHRETIVHCVLQDQRAGRLICLDESHRRHDFHQHKASLHDQIQNRGMAIGKVGHHDPYRLSHLGLIAARDIHPVMENALQTLLKNHTTDFLGPPSVPVC